MPQKPAQDCALYKYVSHSHFEKKNYLEKLDFCKKLSTFKATILHLHPTSDTKM